MGEHAYDRVARDPEIKRSIFIILVLLFVIGLFEGGYFDSLLGVPAGAFSNMIGLERTTEHVGPFCGDSVCNGQEDQFMCLADCGNIAPICKEFPNQCPK